MESKIKLSKEVYLTDPCYNIKTWCQELLKNVKEGEWLVYYEYKQFDDDMQQLVILSLAHEDYGYSIFSETYDEIQESSILGVDSGNIGVFDKEYYEKYHYNDSINDEWYDNTICNFTKVTRRGLNITENKGVWVNTSYGDGVYVAKLYIKNGKICGIQIEC